MNWQFLFVCFYLSRVELSTIGRFYHQYHAIGFDTIFQCINTLCAIIFSKLYTRFLETGLIQISWLHQKSADQDPCFFHTHYECILILDTYSYWIDQKSGPEVIKPISCSFQVSMKFQMLIRTSILNNKDGFCFGALIFFMNHSNKCQNANNCWHLNIYEHDKFYAHLSWARKKFYNLATRRSYHANNP